MYSGIDVSSAQGIIDWNAVKSSGINAVIIRAGYGNDISQEDKYFRQNVEGAKAAGLKVGVYWFCYARDEADAKSEAQACYEIIKGYYYDFPVFYDFEEDTLRYMNEQGADTTKCSENIIAFFETMKENGYDVGLYSNPSCISQFLNNSIKIYPLWLAAWPDAPDLSQIREYNDFNVVIWQYANHQDGSINGVDNVDCDMFYIDSLVLANQPIVDVEIEDSHIDESAKSISKHFLGEIVTYNAIFYTATSEESLTPIIPTGTITKIIVGARNPYLINDGTGWINDSAIVTNVQVTVEELTSIVENTPVFEVGKNVRVNNGATDVEGTKLADFVYQNIYSILAIKEGDKYLIGNERGATAWMFAEAIYSI